MKPKVIIYKNYGCVIWSVGDNGKSDINNRYNFYWSFYELNNGEKFSAEYREDIVNGKIKHKDLEVHKTRQELKNGTTFDYFFGYAEPIYEEGTAKYSKDMDDEFFEYFNSLPPVKDLKEIQYPSKKEEKVIKKFFKKNILQNKNIPTRRKYTDDFDDGLPGPIGEPTTINKLT